MLEALWYAFMHRDFCHANVEGAESEIILTEMFQDFVEQRFMMVPGSCIEARDFAHCKIDQIKLEQTDHSSEIARESEDGDESESEPDEVIYSLSKQHSLEDEIRMIVLDEIKKLFINLDAIAYGRDVRVLIDDLTRSSSKRMSEIMEDN